MKREHTEAAVLFAEVIGSPGALGHCAAPLREAIASVGGVVVKTIGDEIMASFPTADAAAAAATRMHIAVDGLAPVRGIRLALRVGFQAGPVIQHDGDVFGDTVNLAARLAGHAARSQILTSRETAELLSPALRGYSRILYAVEVKGRSQSVELCELLWQQSPDVTDVAGHEAEPATRLVVRHRGDEIEAPEGGLNIGRDADCDIVIDGEHVSRRHCTIQQRHGKFVVQDHSANGTYVSVEGEHEMALHREDYVLRGHGWIAFGQPRAQASEAVEYFCE